MSRPYDLDLDVQRVLAREKELAQENAMLEVGPQLELFPGEAFEDRPIWRHETRGLVIDEDLLFSRAISEHSMIKAYDNNIHNNETDICNFGKGGGFSPTP
ncbi:MAG: hypothetical protein QOH23_353 [Gaiellaceae bacterium]|jgi:hypothetical protein|nr:hypothetical protein [Gaiellaceae bacterium]